MIRCVRLQVRTHSGTLEKPWAGTTVAGWFELRCAQRSDLAALMGPADGPVHNASLMSRSLSL
eukprot:SAG31_NODE_1405_length_8488_cov_2.786029_7_plen_63_part_00